MNHKESLPCSTADLRFRETHLLERTIVDGVSVLTTALHPRTNDKEMREGA